MNDYGIFRMNPVMRFALSLAMALFIILVIVPFRRDIPYVQGYSQTGMSAPLLLPTGTSALPGYDVPKTHYEKLVALGSLPVRLSQGVLPTD
jgi:hypothetical protein